MPTLRSATKNYLATEHTGAFIRPLAQSKLVVWIFIASIPLAKCIQAYPCNVAFYETNPHSMLHSITLKSSVSFTQYFRSLMYENSIPDMSHSILQNPHWCWVQKCCVTWQRCKFAAKTCSRPQTCCEVSIRPQGMLSKWITCISLK